MLNIDSRQFNAKRQLDNKKCANAKSDTISIDGAAASFESIDDVHGSDGFPFGVLTENSSVLHNDGKKIVHKIASFIIDALADSLDASSPRKPSDSSSGQRSPLGLFDFGSLDCLPSQFSFSGHFINYYPLAKIYTYYRFLLIIFKAKLVQKVVRNIHHYLALSL